ncbi:hypothetical protein P7K49_025792 [Saguinus oedipus]|uniref:Uncharacterized protein n=1 Tax=Saguinus oedipus TaxID=9490 RepID=A0ABQ9UJL9_SAGOE|nr:hypothetical protein P7K49_025792 [Saguinus oedipus]
MSAAEMARMVKATGTLFPTRPIRNSATATGISIPRAAVNVAGKGNVSLLNQEVPCFSADEYVLLLAMSESLKMLSPSATSAVPDQVKKADERSSGMLASEETIQGASYGFTLSINRASCPLPSSQPYEEEESCSLAIEASLELQFRRWERGGSTNYTMEGVVCSKDHSPEEEDDPHQQRCSGKGSE